MFHSENRQLGIGTREQYPDPIMDINIETARELGIEEGDWVYVETRRGVIRQRATLTDEIDPRVVNVQSHWWFPEQPAAGALAGRPLGVELQRAHHRRRPRHLRPDHGRLAAAGVALQDLEGGDGGRARGPEV